MEGSLFDSIEFVKGVGPKLAAQFAKRGLATFEDALFYLPRGFEDRTRKVALSDLQAGERCLVEGEIESVRWIGGRFRSRFEATLKDESKDSLTLHWFHPHPGLKNQFKKGARVAVFGEVTEFHGRFQMNHPEFVERSAESSIGVLPIYVSPEGLSQKVVRKVVRGGAERAMKLIRDVLPEELQKRLGLSSLCDAFRTFHFPSHLPLKDEINSARRRLVFEEFFIFHLGLLLNRRDRSIAPSLRDSTGLEQFIAGLPFKLTRDQQRAIQEIQFDLSETRPMARLLQADVGSGKTVVALSAARLSAMNGYQTAILAPTEVLARQHFQTATALMPGVNVVFMVSETAASVKDSVKSGKAQVVVGTHAVIQDAVEFLKLGLVIIDEQHRFGVRQRIQLLEKGNGKTPHLLMMTATPIPRTLSLTLYGDLNLTLMKEKPPGRGSIKTRFLSERERPRLLERIRSIVDAGRQVYVIYPLVEESEKVDLRSASTMFEALSCHFSRVALVHGRMKSDEKATVLEAFRRNEVSILVSTTVVEVGIDVPNATLMVIEHANRLGLSQLHQLRGRVGRGSMESECILVAERLSERLKVLLETDDGFAIAEADLKLRGSGEFVGTRQSGLSGFRLGDLALDEELLILAHAEAAQIVRDDPDLSKSENARLRSAVQGCWREKITFLNGG